MMSLAHAALENAHAPYSGFAVGACVLTKDGHLYAGCNVENASYPCGTCAEEGALAAMVSSGGKKKLEAVLVMGAGKIAPTPCGACRQRIAEFGGKDTRILVCDEKKVQGLHVLGDLLPKTFSLKKPLKKT
ncbi:MAG: cytidine deaminase [Alphaproteobacteria bacterium GWF2_58_20]|nr:MAG: cytidine deaminase [Alphaproteobacteria bacterium GWF2_58_20]